MLIRVRSNRGTWKIPDLDDKEATVKQVLERMEEKYLSTDELDTPLSFDPAGKRLVREDQTLSEQRLGHGSMIYCRVSEAKKVPLAQTGTLAQLPVLSSDSATKIVARPHPGESQLQAKAKSENFSAAQNIRGAMKRPEAAGFIDLSLDDDDQKDDCSIILLDSDSDQGSSCEVMATESKKRAKGMHATSEAEPAKKRARKGPLDSNTKDSKSETVKLTAMKKDGGDELPSKFSVASYNVWFGPPDSAARAVYPDRRMGAISDALLGCNKADAPLLFMGFQEITHQLRRELHPLLVSEGYQTFTQPMPPEFYGCSMAVHKEIPVIQSEFIPFKESTQLRGILYARTKRILFATSHLESFVDRERYTGARQREEQIKEMEAFVIRQLDEHKDLSLVVFTGDLNWDDERARSQGENKPLLSLLSDGWVDAWKSTGRPFSEGHTYDGKDNPMLGGNLRRRFDRCLLLRRDAQEITVNDFQKIGKDAIPGLTWNKKNPYTGASRQVPVAPSDHFGIVVTLTSTSNDR